MGYAVLRSKNINGYLDIRVFGFEQDNIEIATTIEITNLTLDTVTTYNLKAIGAADIDKVVDQAISVEEHKLGIEQIAEEYEESLWKA